MVRHTRKKKKVRRKNSQKKHLKFSRKAKGLNRIKKFGDLTTEHPADGETASESVREILKDLPQNRNDKTHGVAARERNEWMRKQDALGYIENIEDYGIDHPRGQLRPPNFNSNNLPSILKKRYQEAKSGKRFWKKPKTRKRYKNKPNS